jgi:hypothetical protein
LESDELEHYITLFDSSFLPQGLALHSSMKRHAGAFTLWVLCMDEETRTFLDKLAEPTIKTIRLADVETPELLEVKPGRDRAEYCWTLTPFTPKLVFDREPDARRATYIDADMFLLKSPQPIFEEFERSGKAVLITDHAYDPEYDQAATSGQYCVQFMTFVRDASEHVRQWWQDRCVEWCFNRMEDGKCGDQKYLDDWPLRFSAQVHVLCQLDTLLAPWNARRFPYSRAIAWHFHGLRLLEHDRALLHGPYQVPHVVHERVYQPYLGELRGALKTLGRPIVQKRGYNMHAARAATFMRNAYRLLRRTRDYNPVRKLPE